MSIEKKVINNILGTLKQKGGKHDLDGDGVINSKDCQPKNTMRQDRIGVSRQGFDMMAPNDLGAGAMKQRMSSKKQQMRQFRRTRPDPMDKRM